MSLFKEPCVGCGETRSDRRCLGCFHEAEWAHPLGRKVNISNEMSLLTSSWGIILSGEDWQKLYDAISRANS